MNKVLLIIIIVIIILLLLIIIIIIYCSVSNKVRFFIYNIYIYYKSTPKKEICIYKKIEYITYLQLCLMLKVPYIKGVSLYYVRGNFTQLCF